jgi:hypothetical protein
MPPVPLASVQVLALKLPEAVPLPQVTVPDGPTPVTTAVHVVVPFRRIELGEQLTAVVVTALLIVSLTVPEASW